MRGAMFKQTKRRAVIRAGKLDNARPRRACTAAPPAPAGERRKETKSRAALAIIRNKDKASPAAPAFQLEPKISTQQSR